MIYLLFRRRTLFLLVAPIPMLAAARPTRETVLIGLPLVVVGEAIRVWAAGYLTKFRGLVTAGPFALCRNPIYVGTLLICVGYFVMCDRMAIWLLGVPLFMLFYGGAVAYEEKLLREWYGAEFDDYCARVPRFVPRLRRLGGNGRFSFNQVLQNNEYVSFAATVLIVAILALMAADASLLRAHGLASLMR